MRTAWVLAMAAGFGIPMEMFFGGQQQQQGPKWPEDVNSDIEDEWKFLENTEWRGKTNKVSFLADGEVESDMKDCKKAESCLWAANGGEVFILTPKSKKPMRFTVAGEGAYKNPGEQDEAGAAAKARIDAHAEAELQLLSLVSLDSAKSGAKSKLSFGKLLLNSEESSLVGGDLYKVLNVEDTAEESAIKSAYRRASVKHHPDKGGDEATFKDIQSAYDVLSNPEKKEVYDKYGKEGLEQGGGGGRSADDIFSMFFNGGAGGGGGRRGPQKGEDVTHKLKMTLDNLCLGKTVKLSINRQRVKYPDGMNAENAVSDCTTCRGRGAVMKTQQVGPGMIQQMQVRCPACNGQGKSYMKGVKVVKDKKILEVYVEKGMKNKQRIVFSGEADEAPGMLPGDVVFVLEEVEHAVFQRKGADLIMEKKISLKEALTGFSFVQKHPDGRTLIIKSNPGEIVKPNAIKCITDGGMPIHKRPFSKGRLFVVFRVEFPKSLTSPQVTAIKAALPGKTNAEKLPTGDDVEEVTMFESSAEQFGEVSASAATGSAYDSEDEDGPGGNQRVQCQQS